MDIIIMLLLKHASNVIVNVKFIYSFNYEVIIFSFIKVEHVKITH